MRMNHILLNRRWILFSLVLLSPEILAAENLSFNYTRADALSLEPQLGLQAKACHSKADPMDIHVRFDKNVVMNDISEVRLEISGSAYAKSYTIFSSSVKGRAGSAPDFLVPWGAHAKGAVKVDETSIITIPAVPARNEKPFCFSNGGPRFFSIIYPPKYSYEGFLPIFKEEPFYFDLLGRLGAKDFENKCRRAHDLMEYLGAKDDIQYYWPYGGDLYENLLVGYKQIDAITGSRFIRTGIGTQQLAFLLVERSGLVFFAQRKPEQPARTESRTEPHEYNMDENCTEGKCSYVFPTGRGTSGNKILADSGFLVKLNNRSITSLTLNVIAKKGRQTWKWELKDDKHRNDLYASYSFEGPQGVRESYPKADDPYNIAGFYADNKTPGFYSGTLTARSALNTTYTNFNKVTPLSLPAVQKGAINLVNTDSLTFTVGKGSNGAPTLGVFGQPLKFAPLSVNGKEVASAMQIRNACY